VDVALNGGFLAITNSGTTSGKLAAFGIVASPTRSGNTGMFYSSAALISIRMKSS